MRRSRFSVKPNIGRPKARGAAAAPSSTTEKPLIPESAESRKIVEKITPVASNETTNKESNSVETNKPKITRRSAAKPKPNIGVRGTNRAKVTESASDTTEQSTKNDFTTIKPVQSEPTTAQETEQEKVIQAVPSTPEKPDVVPENKVPTESGDKGATSDDAKKDSKLRFRSRFAKARPNLEAVSRPRIRHPSLSHSDTDGFPMKEPPPVQRVVSLTNSESASSVPVFRKPVDVTPGKDVVDIRRTPLKTPTREDYRLLQQDEQTRKRKKMVVLEEPVDRGKLKMKDLIHMNPKANPMKPPSEEEKERSESISELSPAAKPRTRKDSTASTASNNRVKIGADGQIILDDDETDNSKENENEKEADDKKNYGEDDDDAVVAPQVTIGADGEIILNEASLVLRNPIHDTSQEEMEVVHEGNSWSKGGSQYGYRKKRVKLWTENETKKFYLALNAVGTDFSVMVKLFPGRTRAELKRKWQREEKTSRHLLDKAIKDRYQFEKDFFEELYELDKLDEEIKESKERKATEKKEGKSTRKRKGKDGTAPVEQEGQPKTKKRKKGKNKMYIDSSSESDQEEVAVIDKDVASDNGDDTIDESQVIANLQNKPSRSGRTIKTFILGQPGATSTASTSDCPSSLSPLLSPKPSTEIRIRRISGTPASPGAPTARIRTLSSSSQSKPRVRTLSGSSTASTGKAPGQFLALSSIQQAHSESSAGTADMQPGSLVFVQSNPSVNEKGEVTPGLVHIYMVSSPPSGSSSSSPKVGPSTSAPCTPGGFKSNQFSLLRTPSTDSVQSDAKPHHSPTILRKSPKRTPALPIKTSEEMIANVSSTLSETHTILAETEHTVVAGNDAEENVGIQTVELMDVNANENLVMVQDQSDVTTESVTRDDTDQGESVIYVKATEMTDNTV